MEEVIEASRVHGDDHLSLTSIWQNKACILDGFLFRCGVCSFLAHAACQHFFQMFFFQNGGQFVVRSLGICHGFLVFFCRFGNGCDLRRSHILHIGFHHIALTLYRERRNAVTGDLCQQRTGHTFNAEGEGHVLDWAFVAHLGQFLQESLGLFRGQIIQQSRNIGMAVAESRCCSNVQLRIRRMIQKGNGCHTFGTSLVCFHMVSV